MKLRDVFKGLDLSLAGGLEDLEIKGIASDSREVEEGYLFVCIKGFTTDGHLHASQAVERGARALVVEDELNLPVPQVKVPNTRKLLPYLARNFYGNPHESLTLVGVTGTNGKTTVTHLITHCLEAAGEKVLLVGTVAYRMGNSFMKAERTTPPPLVLWRLFREAVEAGVTHVVMEVSSHALTLDRVEGLDFHVSAFTNLSRDHLDFHRTMEHYYWAKKSLFTHHTRDKALINADDPFGRRLLVELDRGGVGFALENPAGIRGRVVSTSLEGQVVEIRESRGSFEVRTPLVGRHNAYNLLASWGVLSALGMDPEEISHHMGTFQGVEGRLERVENFRGVGVFVDYAHTPDALKVVLEALRPITRGKLVVVFGCGGDRDRGKRPLMGAVASRLADVVVVTSDNPRSEEPMEIIRDILEGVEGEVEVEPDRREAIRLALKNCEPGDVVLIAGKGHEDYQIIGDQVFPFDDRKVAREIMGDMGWL